MRLLVVEDDFAVRDAIRDVLEDEGHEVVLATDGRDALAKLRAGAPPCLIILDLMMPIMNGWEFRKEQLGDDALATVPTVIVTADGRAQEKSDELRCEGYLRKPIQPEDLLDAVSKHCRKASPPEEIRPD